jgi:cell shape-determining protein MreC
MNQLTMGLLVALGLVTFFLYNQNQTLTENNLKLENAVAEQQATMDAMKESFEKQGKALQNMSRVNAEIEQEKAEYLQIFARHNLNALAVAKPGLITKRVNNGTNKVFEGIEDDTKNISNLDTSTNDK